MPQTIYLPPDLRPQYIQRAVSKTTDFLYDLVRMEALQGYRKENLETQALQRAEESSEFAPTSPGQTPLFTRKGKGFSRQPLTAGSVMMGGKELPGMIGLYRGGNLQGMQNLPKMEEKGWKLSEGMKTNDKEGNPIYEYELVSPDGLTRIPYKTGKRLSSSTKVNVNLPKTPPAGILENLQDLYSFQTKMERMGESWKSEFTGNVEGRVGWLREHLGVDLGLSDKDATQEVVFRQVSNDLKDTLLRLRSGAQINEQEYARLSRLMPSSNLPDRTFWARYKAVKAGIDDIIAIREKTLEASGFKSPRAPTLSKEQYEVGAVYVDAQGIRKRYLGNNKWGDE